MDLSDTVDRTQLTVITDCAARRLETVTRGPAPAPGRPSHESRPGARAAAQAVTGGPPAAWLVSA